MTFGTFEGYREGIASPYALSNRLFFRSGAAPSAFGAFVDADVQGFFFDDLFYAVAKQSAPAVRLAGYATGFEPGFFTGSIQGQEGWTGGTISGVATPIDASVDQTVDVAGVNQRTGREPGGSRTTPGQLQRELPRMAVQPAHSRCRPGSRHPGPVPISSPRRCGSAPQVR